MQFKLWLESTEKTLQELKFLIPQILAEAQKAYDAWEQDHEGMDAELGSGGICQDIAGNICSFLSEKGFECTTVSQEIGEQHVYTVVKLQEGVYEVDIPPGVYETGGGYNWRKIHDVTFHPNDLVISRIDGDPESFDNYTGY